MFSIVAAIEEQGSYNELRGKEKEEEDGKSK